MQEFDFATVDINCLSYTPHFLGTPNRSSNHFGSDRFGLLSRSKKAGYVKLDVFKGREAKLNRAIFKTLDTNGPQTIFQIKKRLSKQKDLEGTYYASLSKRIHCLEKAGYVAQLPTDASQGYGAALYVLCSKAYLALALDKTNLEEFLNKADDNEVEVLLSYLVFTVFSDQKGPQSQT